MCGIVAIADRDLASARQRGRAATGWCARSSIAVRTTKACHAPWRRPRHAAPVVRGYPRRAAAVHQRSRQRPPRRQRRDLQLPRASRWSSSAVATASAAASDIEVLVHAYEEWGCESFSAPARHVRAGAVRRAHAALLAARDRAGEKPLFYADTPRGLFLASEVKALLVRPEVSREFDLQALDQFLTYEYVIAPRTILKGVHKPAGRALPGLPRRRSARAALLGRGRSRGARVARRTTRPRRCAARWRTAVERQMMSDVPLGVFLSGGIDSSASPRSWPMQRVGGQPVTSFSMGFRRPELQRAAVRARDCDALWPDQPSRTSGHRRCRRARSTARRRISTSRSPTSRCFRPISCRDWRASMSRACSPGDGGDELFGGYDAYAAQAAGGTASRVTPDARWRSAMAASRSWCRRRSRRRAC